MPTQRVVILKIQYNTQQNKPTCAPAWDDAHGAVHRRYDLPAHLAQARVGQAPHPVHERVQLLDDRRHRGHIRTHLERPLLAVLAALVQVFAVGAVA
jgi:hypothetical protein